MSEKLFYKDLHFQIFMVSLTLVVFLPDLKVDPEIRNSWKMTVETWHVLHLYFHFLSNSVYSIWCFVAFICGPLKCHLRLPCLLSIFDEHSYFFRIYTGYLGRFKNRQTESANIYSAIRAIQCISIQFVSYSVHLRKRTILLLQVIFIPFHLIKVFRLYFWVSNQDHVFSQLSLNNCTAICLTLSFHYIFVPNILKY